MFSKDHKSYMQVNLFYTKWEIPFQETEGNLRINPDNEYA